jgi:hypothetical protein
MNIQHNSLLTSSNRESGETVVGWSPGTRSIWDKEGDNDDDDDNSPVSVVPRSVVLESMYHHTPDLKESDYASNKNKKRLLAHEQRIESRRLLNAGELKGNAPPAPKTGTGTSIYTSSTFATSANSNDKLDLTGRPKSYLTGRKGRRRGGGQDRNQIASAMDRAITGTVADSATTGSDDRPCYYESPPSSPNGNTKKAVVVGRQIMLPSINPKRSSQYRTSNGWESYDPACFEQASKCYEQLARIEREEAEAEKLRVRREERSTQRTRTRSPPSSPSHVPSAQPTLTTTAFSTTDDDAGDKKMIEIAPGLSVRLRGSEESWEAVKEDRLTTTFCTSCSELLHCVQEAQFVLCPVCYVIMPLEASDFQSDETSVGLGMKDQDLNEWRIQYGLAS